MVVLIPILCVLILLAVVAAIPLLIWGLLLIAAVINELFD